MLNKKSILRFATLACCATFVPATAFAIPVNDDEDEQAPVPPAAPLVAADDVEEDFQNAPAAINSPQVALKDLQWGIMCDSLQNISLPSLPSITLQDCPPISNLGTEGPQGSLSLLDSLLDSFLIDLQALSQNGDQDASGE